MSRGQTDTRAREDLCASLRRWADARERRNTPGGHGKTGTALLREAVVEVERLREALRYYAERRNHTTRGDDGTPHLWTNDAYDGNGPGARARAALGDGDA